MDISRKAQRYVNEENRLRKVKLIYMINLFKEDIMDVVWSGVTILVIIIFSRIFLFDWKKNY